LKYILTFSLSINLNGINMKLKNFIHQGWNNVKYFNTFLLNTSLMAFKTCHPMSYNIQC